MPTRYTPQHGTCTRSVRFHAALQSAGLCPTGWPPALRPCAQRTGVGGLRGTVALPYLQRGERACRLVCETPGQLLVVTLPATATNTKS